MGRDDAPTMFDIATRTPPHNPQTAGLGVAFDWRLASGGQRSLAAHDYTNACLPAVHGAAVLATYCLACEQTLQTAVLISLFTDARANADVRLPAGQTDRRGWVGQEYLPRRQAWGSQLWTLYATKSTNQILAQAEFAAQEALAWMVADGLASRVAAQAQWAGAELNRLALRVQIFEGLDSRPVYDVLWATSFVKGESL